MTSSRVPQIDHDREFSSISDDDLPDEPDPPQLDTVFGILQNERRRRVLRYVQANEQTTQGELAEHIAAIENDVSRQSLTSTQRKRVYVSLYQSHLPKLDDAGAVAYDADRGTVERTPGTDEFLRYLDNVDEPVQNRTSSQARHTLAGAAILSGALAVNFLFSPGIVSAIALLLVGFGCGLVVRGYIA
jgi:hypothetical protein